MLKRLIGLAGLGLGLVLWGATGGLAADPVKIALVLPLTGPFGDAIGRQVLMGVQLYMKEHGDSVAGRKVELLIKDDTGAPEITKRIVQEAVVNDHAAILAGFGLTPLALTAAPVATQAKVPMIVMAAATSSITEQSPFIVRTSFTLPQVTAPIADWAAANNIHKVATLVSDYGPGIDAENTFKERFTKAGGEILGTIRAPLRNPEFAPYLQRVKDLSPDAVFLFVPNGQSGQLMRQLAEREFDKAGIKVIATGDVVDDGAINEIGDVALGMITSHHYSVAHDSPENKAFVASFKQLAGVRPNMMGVGGYDGMALIYAALEKTGGQTDGPALVDAMKGMSWLSPRGPVQIDPQTRDIIQDVYLRKVEKRDGELYNIEFLKIGAVKDPAKAAKP